MNIPTLEPVSLRAGDTWKWNRQDLSDFPATVWNLKYSFKTAAGHFEVSASASGDTFAIVVDSTTSGAVAAGDYGWVAYVERIASSPVERYQVDSNRLQVLPSFANATAFDDRSSARIALEAIKAVLGKRATKDQEEYTIQDRSLKRTPIADLIKLQNFYERQVAAEEQADNLAAGNRPRGNRLAVRF